MTIHWGFFIFVSVAASSTMAQDLSIVDVRRNITLADEDVIYKDFYINGGEAEGLKKNLVVTALRKIQVRDSSGSQTYGEIQVPVGQLRIVATYGRIAVAREYKLLSRDELPMLEQTGLMSGDRIELKGAFVDDKKPVYKKKVTAAATLPSTTAVVAIVSTNSTTTPAAAAPTITESATAAPPVAPAKSVAAPEPLKPTGPAPASVGATKPEAVNPAKTADASVTKAQ